MTAVATRAAAPAAARDTLLDRFLAAVPLASVFLWLCLVYSVEAWAHGTPWLFTDELEWSQLSRAIAATGHAARRGQPHSFNSLYSYLIAPAWLIHDTHIAYDTIKYIGVAVMTSVVFPVYALARLVVGKAPALFAAAAAGAAPALVYSSFIITEPLAYPYAALCFFLIARALTRPTGAWITGAVVASLLAPFVRGELSVIPASLLLAFLLMAWSGERMRRWRLRWSSWDWVGFVVLAVGAAILLSAFLGAHVYSWLIATEFYKQRMLKYGIEAAGALAIGIGVFPAIAGLAALLPTRSERAPRGLRAFRCVLGSAVVTFGFYTAVKAAYLSTVFATRVEERNLIYLSPLLFVGTAIWLERRRVNPFMLAGAAALALWLVLATPYEMQFHFYSDAPGLAILEQANRYFAWTPSFAKALLVALVVVSVGLMLLPALLRRRARSAALLATGSALLVVAWNVTAEIAAAAGSGQQAADVRNSLRRPLDWLDRATHGQPVLYLGQKITDPNGVWLLEFWNRDLRYVWSLDGTAPGPGPVLTPNLVSGDGRLGPAPPVRYVVADEGVDLVGRVVARHERLSGGGLTAWRLYEIAPPLRLRDAVTNRYADGWIGSHGEFSNFSTPGNRPADAVVTVARRGATEIASRVTVYVGTLTIGVDQGAHLGRVTAVRTCIVRSHRQCSFVIPAPSPRFRVEVKIARTFVPAKLDPHLSDNRELGAVVNFAVRLRRRS